MGEVIEFDAHKVRKYLDSAIVMFLGDPPDTQYQAGYLAALLDVRREAIHAPEDDRMKAATALIAAANPPSHP